MSALAKPRLLSMWVIYDHPSDYPDKYVARRHVVGNVGGVTLESATDDVKMGDTLHEVRASLPLGLIRFARAPQDDPVIVETWL